MVLVWLSTGFLFVCFIAFVCLWYAVLVDVARDVCSGYRDLFRHARRHPRFGIGAVFSLTTIAAATCGLFRCWTDASQPGDTWIIVVPACIAATGVVCAVQFVLTDFKENYSRGTTQRLPSTLSWKESPASEPVMPSCPEPEVTA